MPTFMRLNATSFCYHKAASSLPSATLATHSICCIFSSSIATVQRRYHYNMSLYPQAKPQRQLPTEADIALVVGRAPWWIPTVLPTSKNNRIPFSKALRDFLQNISFHCYGKVVEPDKRFAEKFFWFIFHVIALTMLIMFLWRTRNIDGQLLATTILDPLYPIQMVDFPAVSICSINRISNASATRYARELNAKDPSKRGVNYFYNEIKMLSYNYFGLDDNIDYDRALLFQRFLDIYDTEDSELFYNTRRRMKNLTPSCRRILVKCSLGGEEFNCSERFVTVLTYKGYCCTFNHHGNYSKPRSFKSRFFGSEKGLVVYLNATQNDDFYKMSQANGFSVKVYASGNYAEIFSGGVKERNVHPAVDTYITVWARIVETVAQARYLTPKARNCMFEDEMPHIFGKRYTFNRCITRCRVRSITVLCQCLPFYAQNDFKDLSKDMVFCTLQHRECLRRYNFKWLNVITQRQSVLGLEREMEDALYCPECLPTCRETRYTLSAMSLPLTPDSYRMRDMPSDLLRNESDLALVRVFFGKPHIQYLREIIKDDWFEVFSKVGNICGIIAGFSLIGICEVIFFLGSHLVHAYQDEVIAERNRKAGIQAPPPLLILP